MFFFISRVKKRYFSVFSTQLIDKCYNHLQLYKLFQMINRNYLRMIKYLLIKLILKSF